MPLAGMGGEGVGRGVLVGEGVAWPVGGGGSDPPLVTFGKERRRVVERGVVGVTGGPGLGWSCSARVKA